MSVTLNRNIPSPQGGGSKIKSINAGIALSYPIGAITAAAAEETILFLLFKPQTIKH